MGVGQNILFWIVFLLVGKISAQVDSVTENSYETNILPSPTLTYSDQTDVVVGAYVLLQFKFDKRDTRTRSSYINAYLASSFYDQLFFSSEHRVYSKREKWFFRGFWEYKKFPEPFFGIGPNSSENELIVIDYDLIRFEQSAHLQFKKSFFIGLQARYINYLNVKIKDPKETLETPSPELIANGNYLGLGPSFLWDKRNSLLTPTKEFYIETKVVHYFDLPSSESGFTKIKIDGRKYFDIHNSERSVLAFQVIHESALGNTPIQELPKMGGSMMARGFIEGRFRDNNITQIQAELRQALFWRMGFTIFAHVGEVYDSWEDIDIRNLKSTAGFGLRLNINKDDPANIRIDFGWSMVDRSTGVYLTFGEAF